MQKPKKEAAPPKTEEKMANWRMLAEKSWAVSAGMRRKPNEMRGPTLSTAMETVKPMSKNNSMSQKTTFLRSVMAITLRKNVVFWDMLLFLLIGLTVSMAVLSVGPLISFGFLLIPALTAQLFSANMRQFAIFSSLLGGVASFFGFCIAYRYDLPVGPTDVVFLGIIYSLCFIGWKIVVLAEQPPDPARTR